MEEETLKILDKDGFKNKLTKYLKDQEESGRNFNEEIKSRPEGLGELFYNKPTNRRTEARRKKLKEILTGLEEAPSNKEIQLEIEREPDDDADTKIINFLDHNSKINLYQALPELKNFFERINSANFIKGLDLQRTNSRSNILEVFAEKHISLARRQEIVENQEKFEETVQKARETFKEKMKDHFSRSEYIYFFEYTRIETRQNKDKDYTIKVRVPTSEEEISRHNDSIYILQKFDDEIFPLLNRAIKQETSSKKKYWTREYMMPKDISLYNQRKNRIGTREYTKFLQYEKNGGEKPPTQGELFKDEKIVVPKNTEIFYEYEGNKTAYGLLSQWLESQRDIKGPRSSGVILQGDHSEKSQKLLIEHYIEKIKKDLPFFRIQIIDCENFANKCQKLFGGENRIEPVEKKWERVDTWCKTILPAHVFVLYNLEKLENKIYSQQKLLQVIRQGGKANILATSNKRISEFPEAQTTENGSLKKGFRGDFLNEIIKIPRSSVTNPQDKECGGLLYNLLKTRYPYINVPRNLIIGIGKLIQDTSCYDALIEEIMASCKGGTLPFDFDKAKEIVQNRIEVIYNPTLDEIYNTVNKFFENMDEKNMQSYAQLKTMKKKYTAYFAKKLPLPGTSKVYRTYEDIGNYIKATPNTVRSYISEITDTAIYKKAIEEKINELRNAKEKIIGSCIDVGYKYK